MKRWSVELMLEVQNNRKLVTVSPDDSILKAAEIMKANDIGLVVVTAREDLVGVLSERDVLQRWICGKVFPKEVTVGDIMSRNVEVVSTHDTIQDCYLRFIARNCRHLPVVDPMGRIAGILSLRDVANYVVNRLKE